MAPDTSPTGEQYAVLPLRDIVVFPHMIVPLFVGREKSVKALESAMQGNKQVLLVTQKSAQQDDPTAGDLYHIGTMGTVLQLLKLPDGTVKVLVEGKKRAKVLTYTDKQVFFEASAEIIEPVTVSGEAVEGLMRACVSQFDQYVKLNKKIPPEIVSSISQIDSPHKLADTIASHLSLKIPERQSLLEILNVGERLEKIFSLMEGEISVMEVEKRIRGRVKRQMEKTQREYYLNEQMKAIQKELNEGEELDELTELEQKIKKTRLTKEARQKCLSELKKLRQMSPMSAESTVVRNYLDWMLSVPWNKRTKTSIDLKAAEAILEKDHYGLEKVKERILEYLAVQSRADKGRVKGPILCLVGPPGVGKTSLGKSIAKATNRNFVRMSLGGVRDESEIRGHRRTYIGSMPGRIIQGMKKAKSSNPFFLLDEIDKVGQDWRGDPSAALLEVLDPEQNDTFNDHYMEVDYSLADVMFVCTANSLDLPRPLLDRMEIIRISGYTEDEKVEIAKRHLLSKQLSANGLKKGEFSITDDAMRHLIRHYTREAGVRNLERELSNLARKAIKEITMDGGTESIAVTIDNVETYAGVPRYRFGQAEETDRVGSVTGLAWTEVGGELLQIEAVTFPGGKGKVSMTGKLGDVMKESIQVAEMLIKSRAPSLGITQETFEGTGVHVHVPEGATPKDGPSAGIGMVTAIVSAITHIAVHKNIAMTGEVDLLGQVLPIGGLKEKLLAALRGGITKVLIPKDNVKDLAEIPDNVKKGLEIVPVTVITEVLSHALVKMPKPIDSNSGKQKGKITAKTAVSKEKDVLRH